MAKNPKWNRIRGRIWAYRLNTLANQRRQKWCRRNWVARGLLPARKEFSMTSQQEKCPHLRVIQYAKDGFLAYFHEARQCPDCGLKEVSNWGQYKTPLGAVEFIKHIGLCDA